MKLENENDQYAMMLFVRGCLHGLNCLMPLAERSQWKSQDAQ